MAHESSDGGSGQPVQLNYASPMPGKRRISPVGAMLSLMGLMLLISILMPSLNRPRINSNTLKCAANMKSILQGMILYAGDHRGVYPDSLQTMILTGDTFADMLVCPSCDHTEATGATPQQIADRLTSEPGHLSYIYLGAGLTTRATADTVLVYEPPSNHGGVGINVGFGDGRVEFITGDAAKRLLAEVHSGHNPPRAGMPK